MTLEPLSVRHFWQIIGRDGRALCAARRVARTLSVDATTQGIVEAVRGRDVERSSYITTRESVQTVLQRIRADDEPLRPYTYSTPSAQTVLAWEHGEQEIPQWAARALLHNELHESVDRVGIYTSGMNDENADENADE